MTREEAIKILHAMAFKDGAFVETSKYEDATILAMEALRYQERTEEADRSIDSTELLRREECDYAMLKDKGKSGEGVLHFHGFLDGYAFGWDSGYSHGVHEMPETALTWKDMQYIVESADALLGELPKDKLAMLGSECYYGMILDRYNAFKRKEENYG